MDMMDTEPTCCASETASIHLLPDEILEQIFEYLCPYSDFPNCTPVCSLWRRLIRGVARRRHKAFRTCLKEGRVSWSRQHKTPGVATITNRYSHTACYIGAALYVFGGCTASNTTFNDLWRLDLGTKEWIRPIASGTYPSPKACATMTVWRNQLVLFGGWSQPTPFPLHQAPQFFNQLHLYDTELNTWTAVVTQCNPPPVAGHAACMLADCMIVFGGSHQHGSSSDALWEFNMLTETWRELIVSGECKPLPRYGASMWSINSTQVVLLGGCGGPNMKFTDCWLLTVENNMVAWTEMEVRNAENCCPPPLWCHPMCKVDDTVVVLSKASLPVSPDVLQRISKRTPSRKSSDESHIRTCYSSSSSDDEEMRSRSNMAAGAAGGVKGWQQRRQKQLEMLEKFEKRLRTNKPQSETEKLQQQALLKQPMFIHSLDISTVLDGYVSWNAPNVTDVYGQVAEETFFYSLTEGRGELLMFGGVHPEKEQGMQRGHSSASTPQVLNDSLFIIQGID